MGSPRGTKITAAYATNLANKIHQLKAKWGSTDTSLTFSTGKKITAADYNELRNCIVSAKNKSGWDGTVSPTVNVGQLITDLYTDLTNQGEAIRVHCPCNCNHCACNCNHCPCDCNRCKCDCDNCGCQNTGD